MHKGHWYKNKRSKIWLNDKTKSPTNTIWASNPQMKENYITKGAWCICFFFSISELLLNETLTTFIDFFFFFSFLEFSVRVRAFVIGLSRISPFSTYNFISTLSIVDLTSMLALFMTWLLTLPRGLFWTKRCRDYVNFLIKENKCFINTGMKWQTGTRQIIITGLHIYLAMAISLPILIQRKNSHCCICFVRRILAKLFHYLTRMIRVKSYITLPNRVFNHSLLI